MDLATIVLLSDVSGSPSAQITLPVLLRIGDRVRLAFRLRRQNGGRVEVLDASGEWRVTGLSLDASGPWVRQNLTVENVKQPPLWRAVKKTPVWERRLPPTHPARTVVT